MLIFLISIETDEHMILEYKILKSNTLCSDKAGYQGITTITECKLAAMKLGKSGETVDLVPVALTLLGIPTGCFFDTSLKRIYFNPAENGVAYIHAAPICGKQGKEMYFKMYNIT